jgi:hypothetical protein
VIGSYRFQGFNRECPRPKGVHGRLCDLGMSLVLPSPCAAVIPSRNRAQMFAPPKRQGQRPSGPSKRQLIELWETSTSLVFRLAALKSLLASAARCTKDPLRPELTTDRRQAAFYPLQTVETERRKSVSISPTETPSSRRSSPLSGPSVQLLPRPRECGRRRNQLAAPSR